MSGDSSGKSVKSVKSVIPHASKNRFSLARAHFTILDQSVRCILRIKNHGHHGLHGPAS
jgi:hypothetical protein